MESHLEMPKPFRNNAYALTALLLSPALAAETVATLRCAIHRGGVAWGEVLRHANQHFCSPLLYVRLREHGLLEALPAELAIYLRYLHAANWERNEEFRSTLVAVLRIAEELGIECMLLKGGATFCACLYGDLGARMMGDLDLLVSKEDAVRLQREIIARRGGRELGRGEKDRRLFSEEFEHYHLPRLLPAQGPVDIEIHWEIGSGQVRRGLPAAIMWQRREAMALDGVAVFLPDPTCRLLHVTLHALLPHREYIRSSLALAHLAEFSALRHKYHDSIQWDEWLAAGTAAGVRSQFTLLRELETSLADRRDHGQADRPRLSTLAGRERLLAAGALIGHGPEPASPCENMRKKVILFWIGIFYWQKVPGWIWNNYCYLKGCRSLPRRFYLMTNWILRRLVFPRRKREAKT
ncbi:MAG: nucleotidyltransferase family protein [Desulfuromonadales bacterium]|nr:nucleotidyltransferase family protein [Desulfuromonadales bacterium]